MFSEKDLIESELAGAGPAPELEGEDSEADDLALLDEAFAAGQEAEEDDGADALDDEFDVEVEDGSDEGDENGCGILCYSLLYAC